MSLVEISYWRNRRFTLLQGVPEEKPPSTFTPSPASRRLGLSQVEEVETAQ